MKTVNLDGVDYVVLSPKEYEAMSKRPIIFCGELVEVQVPFLDNNIVNWNDGFNWVGLTGIIYKGNKITSKQLRTLRDIIRGTNLPNGTEMLGLKLDGVDIKLQEIESILGFIEESFTKDNASDIYRDAQVTTKYYL